MLPHHQLAPPNPRELETSSQTTVYAERHGRGNRLPLRRPTPRLATLRHYRQPSARLATRHVPLLHHKRPTPPLATLRHHRPPSPRLLTLLPTPESHFFCSLLDTDLWTELCRLLYFAHQLHPFHVMRVLVYFSIDIHTYHPPSSPS
ncbi:hypothetical protein EGR_10821 [Echinococcus granulosus]|uniref:Uncharacterized protein n=1 Tax=Echinococcus granulosus TaxID=6210 RepID=W6TZQ9_ECHGR|nr:hypothetical protein EGR_10821 [Echinococcus granulosus]EUB54320.1 hypothetical protein EGR_10821 [Echinococcus granulosus]